MKICFIGLGSIAVRHLNNMNTLFLQKGIHVVFDAVRREGSPKNALITNTWLNVEEMPSDYDAIFITNPTSMHYDTLCQTLAKGKAFFIEKPVFDKTEYNLTPFAQHSDKVFYVACPLRYNSVIQWVHNYLQTNQEIYVRSICSSYLPDWRQSVDYRSVYSAHKDMGGGVIIDLIHEWDYLQYLFGFPKEVKLSYGTYSNLEITSEDTADYIATYTDKIVNLHLDYFGRVPRRQLELYTNDDTIIADLNSKTVTLLKENKVISLEQSRDEMYVAELEYFFSILLGESNNTNTIENAVQTMKLTLGEVE